MIDKKLLYLLDFDESWHGGINYFVNQIIGLLDTSDIRIFVLANENVAKRINSLLVKEQEKSIEDANVLGVKFISYPDESRWLHFFRSIFCLKRRDIARTVETINPDVIVHMGGLSGIYRDVYQVAWIPDLQHIELPKNFTRFNKLKRTVGYFFLSLYSNKVMLSSKTQENVFNNFFLNIFKGKTFVNRFRVRKVYERKSLEGELLCLSGKKIILFPSAFWVHKNHAIVVNLIKRKICEDCAFVFTGGSDDYRNLEYSKGIRKEISLMQDEYDVYFFSNISNSKIAALLSNTRVLINPSYYEGWSTIVEEAKLYKVPTLLSNIPTHREQFSEYNCGQLFNPDDINDLEDKFKKCMTDALEVHCNEFDYKQVTNDSFQKLLKNYGIK
mgnify:CR=1 FL=1